MPAGLRINEHLPHRTLSTLWKHPHENELRDRNKTGLFEDHFRHLKTGG
jgi:hypothetical protein